MKIALLSIGDEVLTGQILDRNLQYMASAFFRSGYKVHSQRVCGDAIEILVSTLQELYQTSDIVITTGGLGPTSDDRTKEAISKSLCVPLLRDAAVAAQLQEQWGADLSSLDEQATVPQGAQILPNALGTAPGFILPQERGFAIFLPGVPAELQAHFSQLVLPFIQKTFPLKAPWHSREIAFCLASENAIFAHLEPLERAYPNIEFGIYPRFSHIKVLLRAQQGDTTAFLQETQPIVDQLERELPQLVYTKEAQSIEEVLIALFQGQKIKLALAESCTGGRIAARLVSVPGASECLEAGLVTYSNRAKQHLLGIPEALLETHGAVSEETAKAMVAGALQVTQADLALSITGIAGPQGGTQEKPVGTVFIAIGNRTQESVVQKIPLPHNVDRAYYIDACSSFALYALWQQVRFGILDLSALAL